MTDVEKPDYATLRWVKEGMDETILLARQALEEYVSAGFTGEGIQVYLQHVHQLLGTLRMVQVYGAGMLVEEMERVARLLTEGDISGNERIAESLMLGLVQLPPYLQRLEKGEPDIPLVLLPVLNDLRALRDLHPASEIVLYAPNLDRLVEREPVVPGSGNKQIPQIVRGLRNRYHKGLLLWYRENDLDQGLHEVLDVLQKINAVAGTLRLRRLMDAAEALVVTLIDGEFTADADVKQLFGRIDRVMKRLIEKGEEKTVQDFPTDLLKSLLYFVSRSHSLNPVVQTVKRTADLANSFPDQIHKSPAEAATGADESVLQAVAGALLEDLLQVKEALDLYIRGDREELHRLNGLGEQLIKAGDTLGMLGRGALREKLTAVAGRLNDSLAVNELLDDDQLMQIATVIVEVESALSASGTGSMDSGQEAAAVHDQETEEGVKAVIKEAFAEFTAIKSGVERYLRGAVDGSGLGEVADSVHKLVGVFELAKLDVVADIMKQAEPVLHELNHEHVQLNGVQQSALVDLFAGIEYYLEARLEERSNLRQFTDYAADALLRLTSEEAAEEAEVHPEFEEQASREAVSDEELFADSMLTDELPDEEEQLASTLMLEDDESAEAMEAEETEASRETETVAEEAEAAETQTPDSGIVLQMDDIDPEIFDIFIEEAGEELEVIGSQYPLWKADHSDEQALQNFRRSFHTLKGSGRMVGAQIIGEFSWAVENLLNRIMEGSVSPDDEVIAYLDDVMAAVPVLVKAQAEGGTVNIDVPELEKRGFALAERTAPAEEAVAEEPVSEDLFDAELAVLEEPLSEELVDEESEFTEAGESVLEHSSILLAEDLVEIFKAESATHLAVLDSFMIDCDHCVVDQDVVRAVHTLHGSSHLAEVVPMATLAGEMEHYCKHMHQLSHPVDEAALALFGRFRDTMQQMLDAINSPEIEIEGWESLAEEIKEHDHALPDVISELQASGDTEALSDLIPDRETQEVFLEEAGEILPQLAEHLVAWQEKTLPDTGEKIRRDLHTLKGGARLAGFVSLGDLLHGVEGFFDALLETRGEVDAGTRSRVAELLEDVENALDMLHLNGKLPDLSPQIEIADQLARGMQQLTEESAQPAEQDSALMMEHPEEEPESILLSESWSEEGEFVHEPPVQESVPVEPVAELTKPDVDPELLEIFLEEAGEISEQLEEFYGQWEGDLTAHASIDGLMRNLHTLKGNARFAGLFPLGDLSHALESLFENLASGELVAKDELVPLVRQGLDALETTIDQLQHSGGMPQLADVTRSLEQAAAGEEWQLPAAKIEQERRDESLLSQSTSQMSEVSTMVDTQMDSSFIMDSQMLTDSELMGDSMLMDGEGKVLPFPVGDIPTQAKHRPPPLQAEEEQAGKGERVRVLAELLDQMVNNAGEVSIYRARLEQHNKTVQSDLQELNETISRLRKQLRALELETEAQIRSRHERESDSQRYHDFDPLEMDQYSTLQQLSRALSETINDLSNIGETLSDQTRDADTLMQQQARVTNDLQDGLLRSRMVPFNRQASRLQRVVRQTAQNLGKKAELDVQGAEGEIDRTILNRIMGLLEHLLRNAVAHGVEPPELRTEHGKPETGRVSLVLSREGTEVVLTISDDGAGLDSDAIRKKAVANGMLEADAEVNEDALYQFILQPGFTTATEVTQVAGRGVGMDAVVSEIKQLGGSLEILSQRGRGSSFVIRLPFTLAISEALLVQVADETLAIPHGSAEVIIRVSRKDLRACYSGYSGYSEGIEYNGHQYPVRYLGAMLGIAEPMIQDNVKWYPLLLVRAGEQRMAIQVDQLLGNYQIVVKSIGAQLSGVRWFTGGTILADGKIALLLDVNALVRSDVLTQAPIVEQEEETAGITVMVVDDSITVRKVTSRLLERHNMQVLTARDGVDAITVLQEAKPDVMLLDIEMPRMDGYELARHIRNTPNLADIPIIMITSRTGEKHRERAMRLGVNRYLGKPYQEADLLENIYTLLAENSDA
ncbi:Hpt domain-containing protein [Thiolapillus sp.]|nr:Hpt domain-containing protein [Thiolapillus sp.]